MPFTNNEAPPIPRDIGRVERADIAIAGRLAQQRHHPLMRAAGAVSELGDQPPLFALSGAVLAWGVLSGERRFLSAGGRLRAAPALGAAAKGGVQRLT